MLLLAYPAGLFLISTGAPDALAAVAAPGDAAAPALQLPLAGPAPAAPTASSDATAPTMQLATAPGPGAPTAEDASILLSQALSGRVRPEDLAAAGQVPALMSQLPADCCAFRCLLPSLCYRHPMSDLDVS